MYTPPGDGSFSQNVQRLAFYGEDSWRVSPRFTLNYGLRYQSTFGLFEGSGRSSGREQRLHHAAGAADSHRARRAARLPQADCPAPGLRLVARRQQNTVIRAGFGLYYDDLAQNGWATAFQGVNDTNAVTGSCALTGGPGTYALTGPGCLEGGTGATGNLIGSGYKTPYAIHITGGAEHAFNEHWLASADYVHEQGNHGYRAFPYAGAANLFTRSFPRRTRTTPLTRPTWCLTSMSFNPTTGPVTTPSWSTCRGTCDSLAWSLTTRSRKRRPGDVCWANCSTMLTAFARLQSGPEAGQLDAFGPGDYGPSGEDVRHRFVLAGTVHIRGGST